MQVYKVLFAQISEPQLLQLYQMWIDECWRKPAEWAMADEQLAEWAAMSCCKGVPLETIQLWGRQLSHAPNAHALDIEPFLNFLQRKDWTVVYKDDLCSADEISLTVFKWLCSEA